jgi:hypothetical protein
MWQQSDNLQTAQLTHVLLSKQLTKSPSHALPGYDVIAPAKHLHVDATSTVLHPQLTS